MRYASIFLPLLLISLQVEAGTEQFKRCQALFSSSATTIGAKAGSSEFVRHTLNPVRWMTNHLVNPLPEGGIAILGPNLYRASIPGRRFEVMSSPAIIGVQQQSQWCWAASIKMVLNFYGIPITQENVVFNGHRAIVDKPGGGTEILRSLIQTYMTVDRRIVNVKAKLVDPRSSEEWVELLTLQKPLIAALKGTSANPVGHAFVVTAADFSYIGNQIFVHRVYLVDPWPENPVEKIVGGKEFLENTLGVYLVY